MPESKLTPRRLCLLAAAALLLSSHAALAQFTQQGIKLVGSPGTNGSQGNAVSLSSDGNTLITGAPADTGATGAAWIFTRSGTTWNEQVKLLGSNPIGAANQGQSVAMSGDGNTALVGGWLDNNFIGATWVFVRNGNAWPEQQKLIGSGSIDQPSQGVSVALSSDGNTAIVGGYTDDNSLDPGNPVYRGAAWIFTRSGTTWTQQQKLIVSDSDEAGGGRFGAAVSLSADGNTALIGGYQDNGGQGAAWVFTRSGSTWTQQGPKLVDTAASGANQGVSVALSADGTTAVIGGSVFSTLGVTTGAVWVFTRSGSTWTQQGPKLVGTGNTGDSEQGAAVAVSADGNMLLSGGIVDNTQVGATWVFTRSAGVWSQFNSKLVGNDLTDSQQQQGFGVALSASGRTAAVGGPKDHNSIGATWVYAQPTLATATTLESSDSSSVFGQSVTFTARFTAGATGNVDFKRNGTTFGTVVRASGTAQFTTSALPIGVASITAVYGGTGEYDPSTSSDLTQTVSKGATTTTLSVSPATSSPGQTILFTATIHVTAPAAGSPGGTVTFKDGATVLGTGPVSSGHATLSKAGLTIGSHKITAIYGGDPHFSSSSFTGNSQTGTATVSAKLGVQAGANTHTAGSQQLPAIAKLKVGYFVAWASNGQDGSLYGVYGQRYAANGAKAGGELHISTATAGNQTMPKVAGLKAGGFVTVWQSDAQDGSLAGIYAQNFSTAGGKVGPEFRVNTTVAGAQTGPAIAPLSGGGFVIAWSSDGQDGSGLGVYAQRYDAAARRVGTEFPVNTTTTGAQSAPAIAPLTDGGFVVAWQGPDASGLGVYGQRYTAAGVKSGAEFRINTFTAGDQSLPSAAGLSDGGFVFAWQSNLQDASALGVYAQRYKSTGVKNGGEVRVNTVTASDQWQPQVSGFSDGGFVAMWSSKSQDGSGQGVYTQAFKATGAKANVEFLVNTTTPGDQWQPGVAAGATGEFMAAWTSKDSSLEGIFTQRFKVPVSP